MRTLIFDPFAGISGDMTLAALLDLGLDEAWLRAFVAGLGIDSVEVRVERVNRRGIAARHVSFAYPPERAHRHLHHVLEIIERVNAPARAKRLAAAAFERVAQAEARVHGTTVEKVHFHEVGATDAILDIVCVMAAVCELGFDSFSTRPVAVGSGWVDIEHGTYPVPAPATLGILEGLSVTGTELVGECTTPTGAAILAVLTEGRAAPPQFVPRRIGFGAGSRDPADRPNVLRVIDADAEPASDEGTSELWIVQTDVDDLPAEYAAAAQAAVIDAGALDAVVAQITMKKGRPAYRLEALCTAERVDAVQAALFKATSTIGVRRWAVQRTALERVTEQREWHGQPIRFKRVRLPDGSWREKPEYEDVERAAHALGLAVWEVRRGLDLDHRRER